MLEKDVDKFLNELAVSKAWADDFASAIQSENDLEFMITSSFSSSSATTRKQNLRLRKNSLKKIRNLAAKTLIYRL